MDLTSIGTVTSYANSLQTTAKAEQTVQSKTTSSDTLSDKVEQWKQKQDELVKSAAGIDDEEASKKKLTDIRTKIFCGGSLTKDEKEYLRKNNPFLYQNIEAAENEEKNYENELKRCRTKEEVQRLRLAHTSASISKVNSVKNDAAIPAEKKLEIIGCEQHKMTNIQKSTNKFVSTSRYRKLPTDAETRAAQKRLQEAEENLVKEITETDSDETLETEELTDTADSADEEAPAEVDPATAEADEAFTEAVANATAEITAETAPAEPKPETVIQAQNSPEVTKVRQARAIAAYQAADNMAAGTVTHGN